MAADRLLLQFPLSHYCEKTRWQLDHKGLDYQVECLFPGPHPLRTRRLAGINTLPLLRDDKRWIGDSTDIALYLESRYPQRPLLPAEGEARAQILALEAEFDELGDDVRRRVFGDIVKSPGLPDLMFNEYGLPLRLFGRLAAPLVRDGLGKLYKLSPRRVAASGERMLAGLDRIESLLGGNVGGYLVGDRLTLADITAASLYGPLIGPANSPWGRSEGMPPALAKMQAAARARVAGQWMLRLYAEERGALGWTPKSAA